MGIEKPLIEKFEDTPFVKSGQDTVLDTFYYAVFNDKWPVCDGHLLFVPKENNIKHLTMALEATVEHGDKLDLWGRDVEIRHCPGHCPGNIAFWVKQEGRCFVGDVIFAGSVGRSDLPGGDFAVLEKSIRESIYTLPEDTILHPGHGEDTRVDLEKSSNPFVQA